MHDILPEDQHVWQHAYRFATETAAFYGFDRIDTPILEFTELFEKGTGQGTDIVEKEMYSLRTRGGDKLTLRPEGTPPVARAYIEHGMKKWTSPVKLYYAGPMFRHEKPQRGRFRQFHQFGLETIGEDDPIRDAEIIHVLVTTLKRLRLKDLVVEINSIGCSVCRPKYVKNLKGHYRYKLRQACADCRKRYKNNPLRLLDCEEEKCHRLQQEAPQVVDALCGDCKKHFQEVLDILDAVNVPYLLNPKLVRGLDYYTRTVFEIFEGSIEEASEAVEREEPAERRLAIAAGGRYDKLVEFLGGTEAPAVGGTIGVERLLQVLAEKGKEPKKSAESRVFFVQLGKAAKRKAFLLFEELRKANIPVRESLGRDSISAQLKVANKLGVDLAVIIGQKEVIDEVAIIREMDTGTQEIIPEEKLIPEIKKRLKKKKKT